MTVKKHLLLFLAISLIGCYYSCNKEELQEQQSSMDTGQVYEKNGILNFASETSFKTTIENLIKNQNTLNEWETQFPNFVSMRTAFENISDKDIEAMSKIESNKGFEDLVTFTESNGELEARMNIDDLVLATIINKNGLVRIAESVYKVRYNILYKVEEKNMEILKSIDDSKIQKSLQSYNIESYPVTHNYYDYNITNVDLKADRTCKKTYWKKNRKRLKGEQWTTNIGSLYSGAGARTKHQKRAVRIWWRNKTKKLRLRLNGSYTQIFNGIPLPPTAVNEDSGWKNDDGREAYTFDFCVNASCSFKINSLSSTHECICDDGNYEKCDIIF